MKADNRENTLPMRYMILIDMPWPTIIQSDYLKCVPIKPKGRAFELVSEPTDPI